VRFCIAFEKVISVFGHGGRVANLLEHFKADHELMGSNPAVAQHMYKMAEKRVRAIFGG
jgi:hypothetical protein